MNDTLHNFPVHPLAFHQSSLRHLSQIAIKSLLHLVPRRYKPWLYEFAAKASSYFGHQPYVNIFRLPFGLVLKVSMDTQAVEAHALRTIGSLSGINAPTLIDYVSTPEKTFLLTTWIDGDCCSDIWNKLTAGDKDRIVTQLRSQIISMREQTITRDHPICNASGGCILDPRVPWLDENPRIFTSVQEFLHEVWIGLDFPRNRETLRPMLQPLIERDDVPNVFCHGDILPKNVILPGGLEKWRRGHTTACLIDWEYAGWMPLPWDALKATWMTFDLQDEWLIMMKLVFPESRRELEADWEWRSRSKIPIL